METDRLSRLDNRFSHEFFLLRHEGDREFDEEGWCADSFFLLFFLNEAKHHTFNHTGRFVISIMQWPIDRLTRSMPCKFTYHMVIVNICLMQSSSLTRISFIVTVYFSCVDIAAADET